MERTPANGCTLVPLGARLRRCGTAGDCWGRSTDVRRWPPRPLSHTRCGTPRRRDLLQDWPYGELLLDGEWLRQSFWPPARGRRIPSPQWRLVLVLFQQRGGYSARLPHRRTALAGDKPLASRVADERRALGAVVSVASRRFPAARDSRPGQARDSGYSETTTRPHREPAEPAESGPYGRTLRRRRADAIEFRETSKPRPKPGVICNSELHTVSGGGLEPPRPLIGH